MKSSPALMLLLALALALAACGQAPMPPPAAGATSKEDAPAPSDMSEPSTVLSPPEPVANDLGTARVDGWVGTWSGPEGTSLRIEKQEVGYDVTVTNLDGPREFHGIAVDDVLQFERDGITESVRAGDGKATGMKWLAEKRDCLVVKAGEGYCRD